MSSSTQKFDAAETHSPGHAPDTDSSRPVAGTSSGRASWWRRPAVRGYGLLGLLLVAFVVRHFFFVAVRCEAVLHPQELMPGEQREAVVSLQLVGRAGLTVPGQPPQLRCIPDEGAELVHWRYSEDSTTLYLRPMMDEGDVVMRLITSSWPFPVYAILSIRYPRA